VTWHDLERSPAALDAELGDVLEDRRAAHARDRW